MLAALRHTLIRTWGTLNKQAHSAQHPRTATKKMTDSMLLSCHIKIVAHEKIYSKSSQSQELRCKKVSYKRSRPVSRIRFQMMILYTCIVLRNCQVFCRPSENWHLPCRMAAAMSSVAISSLVIIKPTLNIFTNILLRPCFQRSLIDVSNKAIKAATLVVIPTCRVQQSQLAAGWRHGCWAAILTAVGQ